MNTQEQIGKWMQTLAEKYSLLCIGSVSHGAIDSVVSVFEAELELTENELTEPSGVDGEFPSFPVLSLGISVNNGKTGAMVMLSWFSESEGVMDQSAYSADGHIMDAGKLHAWFEENRCDFEVPEHFVPVAHNAIDGYVQCYADFIAMQQQPSDNPTEEI